MPYPFAGEIKGMADASGVNLGLYYKIINVIVGTCQIRVTYREYVYEAVLLQC